MVDGHKARAASSQGDIQDTLNGKSGPIWRFWAPLDQRQTSRSRDRPPSAAAVATLQVLRSASAPRATPAVPSRASSCNQAREAFRKRRGLH